MSMVLHRVGIGDYGRIRISQHHTIWVVYVRSIRNLYIFVIDLTETNITVIKYRIHIGYLSIWIIQLFMVFLNDLVDGKQYKIFQCYYYKNRINGGK